MIASSRRTGNTWALLEHVNADHEFKVMDLSALDISYFDYDHGNIDDDFIPTELNRPPTRSLTHVGEPKEAPDL